jgi:hypothetical protein
MRSCLPPPDASLCLVRPRPGVALFLAPVWCGAFTRKNEFCRNNSWGLLLGCHLREHRWQKFKMIFVSADGSN